MTRTVTPAITDRIGATAAREPLWAIAFPIFFGYTLGYGLFAAFKPIVQLQVGTPAGPGDATGAQLFGVLVALASTIALVGALTTVLRRHDGLEMFGCAFYVVMMTIYFLALTILIGLHDPTTRPGSSFVPIGFGWFPAVRWAVIVRDRRRRRSNAAAA